MTKRIMTVALLLGASIFSPRLQADPAASPSSVEIQRQRELTAIQSWSRAQHAAHPWYRVGTHLSVALATGRLTRQTQNRFDDAQRRAQMRDQGNARYERLTYGQRSRPSPPGWATEAAPWLRALPPSAGLTGAKVQVRHLRGSTTQD